MEFHFNINDIFKNEIIQLPSTLIPQGFKGDKRTLWETASKVTSIVDAMGKVSAIARGLVKPVTTAQKHRNSDHKLYLLIDRDGNRGSGAVVGILKTGNKSLYLFDEHGTNHQVKPTCILDFYVHESKQRNGLGKKLFDKMLKEETVDPVKLAVDHPTANLIDFLQKHYGLTGPQKQKNNYVVFDGFFPKQSEASPADRSVKAKISSNGLQPANTEALMQSDHPKLLIGKDKSPVLSLPNPEKEAPKTKDQNVTMQEVSTKKSPREVRVKDCELSGYPNQVETEKKKHRSRYDHGFYQLALKLRCNGSRADRPEVKPDNPNLKQNGLSCDGPQKNWFKE